MIQIISSRLPNGLQVNLARHNTIVRLLVGY
nr:MAG TPA: hypothetical protein [Caudoviricetes sp.]